MNKYIPEQLTKFNIGRYTVNEIKNAIENGDILEALVTRCSEDSTLEIDLGNDILGYIPFDELEFSINNEPTKSIVAIARVGRTARFKVKSIEKKNDKYICKLSRKEAQKECYENFISKLVPGQVVDAMPTHVEKYGVFCDIGNGINALLPINNISIAHIREPKRDLRNIGKLKTVVKSIENNRITLTHKELLGTWESEAAKFKDGDTVVGIVREVKDYGVFIELTPNLVGLADSYPDVQENDTVSVFVKCRYADKMKVKLLIVNRIGERTGNIYYKYNIPESGFVKDWVYSPESCENKIESHFDIE